jgi:CSLREA domain-containing protein
MKPQSKWWLLLLFISLLFLFSACTPAPYCDANYTVTKTADTDDGVCHPSDCSLREAVLNANACSGPHTITVPAGGYTLTIPGIDEDIGKTGDLDITKDLTIIGTGAPSIHGNIERAFHIHSGATVTFDHIWLADGTAIFGGGLINEGVLTLSSFTCNYNSAEIPPGGMGDAMGGCIFNTGELTILGGQFLANTAGYGGAIYNYQNASLTIDDVNFIGNEADGNGGAINNDADANISITNSEFSMNEAIVNGGGIWNHGTVDASGLYFEDNHAAGNGGGFFNWIDSEGYITNTWLTLNTADLGGAVYNEEGMLHFYQSGMTANTATGGAGGGIYNLGPAGGLLLRNTTLSANTATGGPGGGGLYNTGNLQLRFITVADNNPEGIRVDGGAETTIRSSALANNVSGNCAGLPLSSEGHNIENDGTCGFAGWNDLPNTNPLLEPLTAYAGMAPSHALGVGSPAIDSGDPDRCTAIDQHGTTRPQGMACDRGAHENLYTKGIIRGWTYTDENDNSVRDPGEGAVSGALLTLNDGPCPSTVDILTVESDSLGFYEIYDIDPGVYCLATPPIQQTLDPISHDLTIAEGTVLEDINFRYVLPVPDASASGLVWHDLCAVPYSPPSTPPPGCVDLGGGSLGADGIYDPLEPGIGGLLVRIGTGPCPISLILTEVPTNSAGEFDFAYLFGGATYCIEIDALLPPNDTILIPGIWTYPVRGAAPAQVEINPAVNEDLVDINFGWDYQFLPFPPLSFKQCIVLEPSFVRFGGSTDYPTTYSFPEGHPVEILARSMEEPLWYKVMDAEEYKGWVFSKLLYCPNTDPDDVEKEPDPEMPKEPKPTKTPTPPCTRDLPQDQCIASGGTWSQSSTSASYCICP